MLRLALICFSPLNTNHRHPIIIYICCSFLLLNLTFCSSPTADNSSQHSTTVQLDQNDWTIIDAQKNNKSANRQYKGRTLQLNSDGNLLFYLDRPDQYSAISTVEEGKRIFYDQKVKASTIHEKMTGKWTQTKEQVSLNFNSYQKLPESAVMEINFQMGFNIHAKQKDTLLFQNDSMTWKLIPYVDSNQFITN